MRGHNDPRRSESTPTSTLADGGLADLPEAAKFLRVSRAKLYTLMESGDLPFVKMGKSRRVPWKALHQLIERSLVGV
jgi:excisionase family DNA binding protein